MRKWASILIILRVCLLLCGCVRPAAVEKAKAPQNDSKPQMTILSRVATPQTDARPLEGLSSKTPQERLQIVRQAQNKWGASKVAANIDQKNIIGRWSLGYSDACYRVFNADGTLIDVAGPIKSKSTYRFLSNHEIELTCPGLLFGNTVLQLEYRLLGDTLELKAPGFWATYHRYLKTTVPSSNLMPPLPSFTPSTGN